jgi:predicted  nucleic acid-binding Zn-ribbon protein
MNTTPDGPALAVFENVRCLECGTVYGKPSRGRSNLSPGCPKCGYVGWLSVDVSVNPGSAPHRSDEDPPLGHSAQSR